MHAHEVSWDYMRHISSLAAGGAGAPVRRPEDDGWVSELPCGGFRFDLDPRQGRGSVTWRRIAERGFLGLINVALRRPLISQFVGCSSDLAGVSMLLHQPSGMQVDGVDLCMMARPRTPLIGFSGAFAGEGAPMCWAAGSRVAGISIATFGDCGVAEFAACARLSTTLGKEVIIGDMRFRVGESDFSMIRIVRQMLRNPFQGAVLEAYLKAKVVELLCILETGALQVSESSDAVARARAMIERDLTVAIDLAALADHANTSRRSLTRWFRAETGVAPGEYLRRRRLEHAADLLATTDQPLVEIAAAIGYAEPASFTRAFHGEFGVTPSVHRRTHSV